MKTMVKVRIIYLLLAILLLVQPVLFSPQPVKASSLLPKSFAKPMTSQLMSLVFQDDFSDSLLWTKVLGTPGPGTPQPPAVIFPLFYRKVT
jgi:hypothetical protein